MSAPLHPEPPEVAKAMSELIHDNYIILLQAFSIYIPLQGRARLHHQKQDPQSRTCGEKDADGWWLLDMIRIGWWGVLSRELDVTF